MELQNMKRTKKENTKGADAPEVAGYEEDYPYGLSISLEKEGLEKLGLDISDFSIGGTVDMVCQAEVTSLSESAGRDGDYSSVSIQITDIAMKQRPKQRKLRDVMSALKE